MLVVGWSVGRCCLTGRPVGVISDASGVCVVRPTKATKLIVGGLLLCLVWFLMSMGWLVGRSVCWLAGFIRLVGVTIRLLCLGLLRVAYSLPSYELLVVSGRCGCRLVGG